MGLRLDLNNKEDRKFLHDRGLLDEAKMAGIKESNTKPRSLVDEFDKKPSKFGNKKVYTEGEDPYDSIWEHDCHQILKLLQKAGIITSIERQIKFKFYHDDIEIWGCKLDFRIIHKNGKEYLLDAKTKSTTDNRIWRTHVKMLKAFEKKEVIMLYKDKGNKTDVYSLVENLV